MKTLIWKEWREQRLFFFLAVGIIILSRAVPLFLPKGMLRYDGYAGTLSHLLLPILFALFLGAITFTNEFTRNTKSFLLSQPFTAARVFWVKFLSGLVLLLVLLWFAHLVFGVPLRGVYLDDHQGKAANLPILLLLLSSAVVYSSACLSSLLLKNTLSAIICTPFILLVLFLFVFPLLVALYLVSSIYLFLCLFFLLAVFIVYGFLIWQRALAKDAPPGRTILAITAVILVFSFGIHAIASLIVNGKFNKTAQKARASGIKLTLQEIVPPPVFDKDNAALVYQKAFTSAEKLEAKYKKEWEYMPYEGKIPLEKLTPAQKITIGRIIRVPEFTEFYVLIEKATNLSGCRFVIRYEMAIPVEYDLDPISKMRNLARLVAARTYILTEEKRYREAFGSAKVGFCLGDSLKNEPLLMYQLVRAAIDVTATSSSRSLLSAPKDAITAKEYQELISEIDRKDKRLTKAIEGEPIIYNGYNYNMKSIYLNAGKLIPPGNRNFLMVYPNYVLRPMFKAESAFYMQGIMTLVNFFNEPYFTIRVALDGWEKKIAPNPSLAPRYVLARMAMPALSGAIVTQTRYIANLESFKLALALKIYKQKHGYYPDKITVLSPEVIPELPLDPFTGKDYIYRKEGRGFILYSVGPNGKDDNGVYDQKQSQKFDDIAWKVLD